MTELLYCTRIFPQLSYLRVILTQCKVMAALDERDARARQKFPSVMERARSLTGLGWSNLSFLECLNVLANDAFVPGEGVPEGCRSPPWIPSRGDESLVKFLDYSIR